MTLWLLLHLSVTFDSINHGTLLCLFHYLGGALFYCGGLLLRRSISESSMLQHLCSWNVVCFRVLFCFNVYMKPLGAVLRFRALCDLYADYIRIQATLNVQLKWVHVLKQGTVQHGVQRDTKITLYISIRSFHYLVFYFLFQLIYWKPDFR